MRGSARDRGGGRQAAQVAWQRARAKYLGEIVPNDAFSGMARGPVVAHDGGEYAAVAEMMLAEERGWIDRYGIVTVSSFHWLRERLE